MAAIVTAEPPPLTSLVSQASPSLERLILRCLAKDPDDRWQTARDLAAELRWIAGAGAGTTAALARASQLPRALQRSSRGHWSDCRGSRSDGAVDVAQIRRRRRSTVTYRRVSCRPPDSRPMVRASSTARAGRASPTAFLGDRRAPTCAISSWTTRGSCRSPGRATWRCCSAGRTSIRSWARARWRGFPWRAGTPDSSPG